MIQCLVSKVFETGIQHTDQNALAAIAEIMEGRHIDLIELVKGRTIIECVGFCD
jgi:hypothetical protein